MNLNKSTSSRHIHAITMWAAAVMLCLAALLLSACGGREHRRYVIGVSQCSEDTWRDKLNEELRIAALYYNNVDVRIKSAYDDVRLQTEQIDRFVDEGVDLLIIAPGQVSISPAIDRAYKKGIPVIIFDRRTRSNMYTAYIGADNREIGRSMGQYLAGAAKGCRVVELCGLSSSSPAIERSEGFEKAVNAMGGTGNGTNNAGSGNGKSNASSISIVKKVHADWTEQGAYRVMDSLLTAGCPPFNCLFAHNDRMAMGARRAVAKHGMDVRKVRFCGIDAMPQQGGGMQLVADGVLFASYIYPTRGDEVMQLAMNILEGRPFKRDNRLSSALVTQDNARVLLMQNDETMRQQERLSTLRNRVDKTAADFNTQRAFLLALLVLVALLIVACAYALYAYRTKTRLTHDMEQMTHTQLQFFTNVSHELRTPLTLIAGPTEQLLESPAVRGTQRQMLEMVQRNTRILTQLVGEILDFRKVQNGKAKLHLNRFAVADELGKWTADFGAVAARHHIRLTLNTSACPADAVAIADRDKLEHIFFNLMSNALKYTPDGGQITVKLEDEGSCSDTTQGTASFILSVSDTGRGVAPEELPHLFERFYQARGAVGGTGIGLALVKAYVDLHHGKVHAESEEGHGTTFVVSLPATQPGYDPTQDSTAATTGHTPQDGALMVDDSYMPADVAAAEQADRITNAEDFDSDKPLILIIDDNSGMRTYLRSILQDRYNVSEAVDGRQGLERARREVPKLVVCDVMMPVMDGLEFTRQLKQDTATSHIPVILLTARSLSEQREEGYGTGADSYITKPFAGSLLLARIDNLLRSRTLLRSLFSGSRQEEEAEERLGTHDQTFVTRLRDIIRRNLSDSSFSVERIGEEIGLSRVQLYRKVKALTGQTPVELLRRARLEKGRQLIEKTDRSIAEIAYEVGFTSPSYFNKCFREEFGTSPGAMRE